MLLSDVRRVREWVLEGGDDRLAVDIHFENYLNAARAQQTELRPKITRSGSQSEAHIGASFGDRA